MYSLLLLLLLSVVDVVVLCVAHTTTHQRLFKIFPRRISRIFWKLLLEIPLT